ncbi:MAG: M24 family metallopeptidase [Bryobacteraceae bacterium]
MVRDELIHQALAQTNWDLLVCAMPANVLLLSGYWPAIGFSVALVTRDGQIVLIVPEDEDDLAKQSWADEVATYAPSPLENVLTAEESLFETFVTVKRDLGLAANSIGFEQADAFEPAGYAPHLFRGSAARLLRRVFPSATLAPADELLAQLRTIKTSAEIEHIRTACQIAERAFLSGARLLRAGLNEAQAAATFRISLTSCLGDFGHVKRCDGFVHCMSGVNSATACGPYGRSRLRRIEAGDLVTIRCHSYADGYWADITRTYHVGPLDDQKQQMFEAVFAARTAALDIIRPGVRASDVDRAARQVFESLGLGPAFKHPAGNGAGFGAADHAARPRLHPKSEDILEAGMVLKLEPGVYLGNQGGVRKADMVAVTEDDPLVLTRFHWDLNELVLNGSDAGS